MKRPAAKWSASILLMVQPVVLKVAFVGIISGHSPQKAPGISDKRYQGAGAFHVSLFVPVAVEAGPNPRRRLT